MRRRRGHVIENAVGGGAYDNFTDTVICANIYIIVLVSGEKSINLIEAFIHVTFRML